MAATKPHPLMLDPSSAMFQFPVAWGLRPLVVGNRGHAHRLDFAAYSPTDGRGAHSLIRSVFDMHHDEDLAASTVVHARHCLFPAKAWGLLREIPKCDVSDIEFWLSP
jgi:hypothetical protein